MEQGRMVCAIEELATELGEQVKSEWAYKDNWDDEFWDDMSGEKLDRHWSKMQDVKRLRRSASTICGPRSRRRNAGRSLARGRSKRSGWT